MVFSPLYLRRLQEATEKCEADAAYLFPKSKFEIRNIRADLDNGRGICIVDFKPKDYQIDEDICSDTCDMIWSSEYNRELYEEQTGEPFDYDKCVEGCKRELDVASWGSVEFYLDNHELKEATMNLWCGDVEDITYMIYEPDETPYWQYTEEEWEEIKARWRPLIDECDVDIGSLHVHHFVPGVPHDPLSYHDDPPVVCYVHPRKCKVDRALQLVYGDR